MDINFLNEEGVLEDVLGPGALQGRKLLNAIKAKDLSDFVSKTLCILILQALQSPMPQLCIDNISEYKATLDLKKLGLTAALKLNNSSKGSTGLSVPSINDFDDGEL